MLRFLPLLCLALAACGGGSDLGPGAGGYFGGPVALECAPFARALTGVALSGEAADWWQQASGRYARGPVPEVGGILVFKRSARLPSGHVAVVSRVLSRREIWVTQANWVHRRVTEDQPVLDVSARGDWTQVRAWWPPSGQMGVTEYPVYGFIRPDRPPAREQLRLAMPAAARLAEQER